MEISQDSCFLSDEINHLILISVRTRNSPIGSSEFPTWIYSLIFFDRTPDYLMFFCTRFGKIVYKMRENIFFINFLKIFIFERETERDREWVGEGQRKRPRHRMWNRLRGLSCQQRAQNRAGTQELWDHDLGRSLTLNWAIEAPWEKVCFKVKVVLLVNSNLYFPLVNLREKCLIALERING